MALAATTYLSVMGPQGLKEVANTSVRRAHYLADKIKGISGFKVLSSDFLYEFVVQVQNIRPDIVLKELEDQNILFGIRLDDKFEEYKNCILVCVTEMNSVDDINKTVECLRELSAAKSGALRG
jgi:glycine dehydrogenase subunit 1